MMKKAKMADHTAIGQVLTLPGTDGQLVKKKGFKRRSKVPGVMITQYIEHLPEGKNTPDFTRKPIPLTIQEGKLAIFKAIVTGDPEPKVTWSRAKGEMNDPQKYQNKYNPTTGEHTLEIPQVSGEEADTYKCYATNEFGKAVCTVVLNVIEVGFKKKKAMQEAAVPTEDPAEFRKLLRKSAGLREVKKQGEIDEKVWEILLSADKKDYERICMEYGITDFRGMLKKLGEMKREREEEQARFIKQLSNLKHIEVKAEDLAQFELDLELNDPNSRIFLYKDGVMIPYSREGNTEMKHSLRQVGKKYIFSIKNLHSEDAGLYQVDVEGVNIFSTDFKIPPVEFLVKIEEVKATEREDALFECVISQPLPHIYWIGKNIPLEAGEKYDITVSENMLIHRLLVKDCMPVDQGIYAAVAGITSCNAWLIVEADKDPSSHGKKTARKGTVAGGSGKNLEKIAQEQQEKLKQEMMDLLDAEKKAQAERQGAGRAGGVAGVAGGAGALGGASGGMGVIAGIAGEAGALGGASDGMGFMVGFADGAGTLGRGAGGVGGLIGVAGGAEAQGGGAGGLLGISGVAGGTGALGAGADGKGGIGGAAGGAGALGGGADGKGGISGVAGGAGALAGGTDGKWGIGGVAGGAGALAGGADGKGGIGGVAGGAGALGGGAGGVGGMAGVPGGSGTFSGGASGAGFMESGAGMTGDVSGRLFGEGSLGGDAGGAKVMTEGFGGAGKLGIGPGVTGGGAGGMAGASDALGGSGGTRGAREIGEAGETGAMGGGTASGAGASRVTMGAGGMVVGARGTVGETGATGGAGEAGEPGGSTRPGGAGGAGGSAGGDGNGPGKPGGNGAGEEGAGGNESAKGDAKKGKRGKKGPLEPAAVTACRK
uniref:Immunoglobulin like and fibronectin type III domain containing 1, tandem duplicate 1 n=1 Tax=Scleropages formosus TaxID=113540 RepID=A0A8C9S4F0_SCLFO